MLAEVEITPEHQFNAAGYMIIVAHLAQLLLSADFMYYYVPGSGVFARCVVWVW